MTIMVVLDVTVWNALFKNMNKDEYFCVCIPRSLAKGVATNELAGIIPHCHKVEIFVFCHLSLFSFLKLCLLRNALVVTPCIYSYKDIFFTFTKPKNVYFIRDWYQAYLGSPIRGSVQPGRIISWESLYELVEPFAKFHSGLLYDR